MEINRDSGPWIIKIPQSYLMLSSGALLLTKNDSDSLAGLKTLVLKADCRLFITLPCTHCLFPSHTHTPLWFPISCCWCCFLWLVHHFLIKVNVALRFQNSACKTIIEIKTDTQLRCQIPREKSSMLVNKMMLAHLFPFISYNSLLKSFD